MVLFVFMLYARNVHYACRNVSRKQQHVVWKQTFLKNGRSGLGFRIRGAAEVVDSRRHGVATFSLIMCLTFSK